MRLLVAVALVCVAAAPAAAESKPEDYLDKAGMLKEKLEIRDLQGGFAGFTGRAWIIEPDGSYQAGRVGPNDRFEAESKGRLSKEKLAELARQLARNDLLALKDTGEAGVNPHVVTIQFGKRTVTLNLPAGEPLPKPNPDKPTAEGRFSAIVKSVEEMLKEKK
jgi:hypothetical protein